MARWHAARWRTHKLGPVLSRHRKSAGVTVVELAQCLIAKGFSADEIADAQGQPDEATLAGHIKTIEAGGEWPFDDSSLEAFLRSTAACLSASGMRLHEEQILEECVRAVGDDQVEDFLNSTEDDSGGN